MNRKLISFVVLFVFALGLVLEAQIGRFRIRQKGSDGPGGGEGETFSIVMIPDTQSYAEDADTDFYAQTDFIVDHETSLNIQFVTHLGDVVEGGTSETQYDFIDVGWDAIDAADIINTVSAGNHDSVYASDSVFYQHYGAVRHSSEPWWCGFMPYPSGSFNKPLAQCALFSAGGTDFLHISLGYLVTASSLVGETTIEDDGDTGFTAQNKSILRWARDKIEAYPTRQVILTFHQYLLGSGSRATGYNEVYNLLIAPYPQIFLVLNGHEISSGSGCVSGKCEAHITTSTDGRDVHQLLFNAQNRGNGDGWMQILTFDPGTRQIQVKTYSPTLSFVSCTIRGVSLLLGQCETDADSQFTLTWPVFP